MSDIMEESGTGINESISKITTLNSKRNGKNKKGREVEEILEVGKLHRMASAIIRGEIDSKSLLKGVKKDEEAGVRQH